MDETATKLQFLEARLTLVERKLARLEASTQRDSYKTEPPQLSDVSFNCSSPGLFVANMYPPEWDDVKKEEFCWVGSDGPLQFILPIKPVKPLLCRLKLGPHPAVDMALMKVFVNDEAAIPEVKKNVGILTIEFPVPVSLATAISIVITGITSIRPSERGENRDDRLLATRFVGADVVFISDIPHSNGLASV